MNKPWRHILAVPIVFLFACQIIAYPAAAGAAEVTVPAAPSPVVSGPAVISLEQAIGIVKQNFEIPKELSNFSSGYNNYNFHEAWSLNWSSSQEPGGNFNAQVDANTGDIINVNSWKSVPNPGNGFQLPAVTAADAKNIAINLVNRLLTDRSAELQLIPDDNQIVPISRYGPSTYSVRWQRVINGIPFSGNGVTVQVSGDDGHIMSYNLNWTKTDFPAAKDVITKDKARQIFEGISMLELQYFMPPVIRPLVAGEKPPVQLVYQLNNAYNGAIDALTGEPLKLQNGQWLNRPDSPDGMGGMPSKAGSAPPLTPQEQDEVARNAKLISKDDAVAAVKRWVEIPDNLILRGLNLDSYGGNGDNPVWSLNWNSSTSEDGKPVYMYARVDAATGELLAFNQSYSSQGNDKPQEPDRNKAQQIAETFLKQIQPEKFAMVQIDKTINNGFPGKPLPNPGVMQSFYYRRVVNGLAFPANGMNVTVDTQSGRIISYDLNWSNRQFADQTNILSQKQVVDLFLQDRPLTLSYVQIYDQGQPGQIRLVYQPVSNPGVPVSNVLDAKTGKFLDWQGNPVSQALRAYHFSDIAGNPAEKEISLLGQAGLFGEYGDIFKPDENITVVSLVKTLFMLQNGTWYVNGLADDGILKRAKTQGWLKEDLPAGSPVSRELLAKVMIRFLSLERIAQLKETYQIPYQDVASLSPESIGYIALAKALGVLQVSGANLEPDHPVSRAEAAVAIVKALGS